MKLVVLLGILASVIQITVQNKFGQQPYVWGAAGHGWAGSQVDRFQPETKSISTRNDDRLFQRDGEIAEAEPEPEPESESSSSSSSEESGETTPTPDRKIKATPANYVLPRYRRKLSYPPELHVKRVWTPRAKLQTRSGDSHSRTSTDEYGIAGTLWDNYRPRRVYIRGDESALFEDENERPTPEAYTGPLRIYRRIDVRPLTAPELRSLGQSHYLVPRPRRERPETKTYRRDDSEAAYRRKWENSQAQHHGLELPPRLYLKSGDDVYFGDGINWNIYRTPSGFTRVGTRDGQVVVRVFRPFGPYDSSTTI